MFHEYNIPSPDDTERYSWHILDIEGTEIASFKNTLPRFSTPGFIVPINPLYMYDESAHFKEYGVDSIYYFDNRVVMPYAIFNKKTNEYIVLSDGVKRENRRKFESHNNDY